MERSTDLFRDAVIGAGQRAFRYKMFDVREVRVFIEAFPDGNRCCVEGAARQEGEPDESEGEAGTAPLQMPPSRKRMRLFTSVLME